VVYLRKKKVKGVDYLYLVKSTWDKVKKTSRQETIKYLGESSSVTRDDIPETYRDDPKINSFLLQNTPKDREKREKLIEQLREKLFSALTEGSLKDTMAIYTAFVSGNSLDQFYERVMTPVMSEIGYMWSENKLSIATEHVASNVAQTLVKIIMEQISGSGNKKKIMICVPVGEEHHMGCDVLETYLTIKGFKVFNMGTSIPTESIIEFINMKKPDVALISITINDNILAGQRLAKKIREQSKIPILVGGYAMQIKNPPKFEGNVIGDMGLEEIPKIIRKIPQLVRI